MPARLGVVTIVKIKLKMKACSLLLASSFALGAQAWELNEPGLLNLDNVKGGVNKYLLTNEAAVDEYEYPVITMAGEVLWCSIIIVTFISFQSLSGLVPLFNHVYVHSGPRGMGKTSIARATAKKMKRQFYH